MQQNRKLPVVTPEGTADEYTMSEPLNNFRQHVETALNVAEAFGSIRMNRDHPLRPLPALKAMYNQNSFNALQHVSNAGHVIMGRVTNSEDSLDMWMCYKITEELQRPIDWGATGWDEVSIQVEGENHRMVDMFFMGYDGSYIVENTEVVSESEQRGLRYTASNILHWFGEHRKLYTVFSHLAQYYTTRAGDLGEYGTAELVVRLHLLHALHRASRSDGLQAEVPWEWQEPVFLKAVLEEVANEEAFADLYHSATMV